MFEGFTSGSAAVYEKHVHFDFFIGVFPWRKTQHYLLIFIKRRHLQDSVRSVEKIDFRASQRNGKLNAMNCDGVGLEDGDNGNIQRCGGQRTWGGGNK